MRMDRAWCDAGRGGSECRIWGEGVPCVGEPRGGPEIGPLTAQCSLDAGGRCDSGGRWWARG